MAFVVPAKGNRFEIRESSSTARGPRSQTLASFRELTDEVIEKATAKAANPPSAEELRRAARRAGATVTRPPIEQAARELIAELAKGRRLDPTLHQILVELLERGYREEADASPANEAARSVAMWMAATPEDRSRALVDLLLLADALPTGGRKDKPLLSPPLEPEPGLPDKVVALHEALQEAKIPHAIGGALALAYYAEPRATIDIDINVFVQIESWRQVVGSISALGVDASDLDLKVLEKDGRCRLWWGDNAVDLFFACDAIHSEMRKQTRRAPFWGVTLQIVAPEHLAVYKAMLNRPKDWLDIEKMVIVTDDLDTSAIEGWLVRMAGEDDPRLARFGKLTAQPRA